MQYNIGRIINVSKINNDSSITYIYIRTIRYASHLYVYKMEVEHISHCTYDTIVIKNTDLFKIRMALNYIKTLVNPQWVDVCHPD